MSLAEVWLWPNKSTKMLHGVVFDVETMPNMNTGRISFLLIIVLFTALPQVVNQYVVRSREGAVDLSQLYIETILLYNEIMRFPEI
jgi:hypothetical protein